MKYSETYSSYFLTVHRKLAYSISRLLGLTLKNDDSRAISGVEIRDTEVKTAT
jgi:hypothetical protein